MSELKVKPALCLDLDGTVRRSKAGHRFIKGPEDIELIPGVEEAIIKYYENGYFIAGITNQGGVAHGFKTIEQIKEEFRITLALFKNQVFSIIAYCPNEEKGNVSSYNYRSLLRKPQIGMLVEIELGAYNMYETIVDWNKSLMVGDRTEDLECAKNAGIEFIHIQEFLEKNG